MVEVLAQLGVAGLASVRTQLEECERDKVLVQTEVNELRERIRALRRARIDHERVRAAVADVRLLYQVASGQERGELLKLLFKKSSIAGPISR